MRAFSLLFVLLLLVGPLGASENNTNFADRGGIGSTQTAATGTNWTALTDLVCNRVSIINRTGTTLEVRYGSAGATVEIADGTGLTFNGITNASDLQIRRDDTSNTQVTVSWLWEGQR